MQEMGCWRAIFETSKRQDSGSHKREDRKSVLTAEITERPSRIFDSKYISKNFMQTFDQKHHFREFSEIASAILKLHIGWN
jgi:hypothetical protein